MLNVTWKPEEISKLNSTKGKTSVASLSDNPEIYSCGHYQV